MKKLSLGEVRTFDIEIVAIGSELCYGKVADTNSFWLADQVTRVGGIVSRITCVRDDEVQIVMVLEESLKRKPRFLLVTGGLGPTEDDKTISAISRLANLGMITDEKTLEMASERKNIPREKLPPHFVRMARTLSGAKTFANPLGISPASVMKIGETTLVVMPGPPKEVQAIFETHISDLIEEQTSHKSCSHRVVVDMVESEVTPIVEEIEKGFGNVYLKPLVSEYVKGSGLPIEILAFDANEEACDRLVRDVVQSLEWAIKAKGRRIVTSPCKRTTMPE